ncbi:unnamed protein product [Moneuplotes crassus]|uniref:Uncharacterized protein n=1 Tax=Euplotes crassus TaxID=5936 RepID=A0AAD1UNG6_EUPCR|nr:unnamed protein product [Moneuplotes crassus]
MNISNPQVIRSENEFTNVRRNPYFKSMKRMINLQNLFKDQKELSRRQGRLEDLQKRKLSHSFESKKHLMPAQKNTKPYANLVYKSSQHKPIEIHKSYELLPSQAILTAHRASLDSTQTPYLKKVLSKSTTQKNIGSVPHHSRDGSLINPPKFDPSQSIPASECTIKVIKQDKLNKIKQKYNKQMMANRVNRDIGYRQCNLNYSLGI